MPPSNLLRLVPLKGMCPPLEIKKGSGFSEQEIKKAAFCSNGSGFSNAEISEVARKLECESMVDQIQWMNEQQNDMETL